jgi:hypothetical protein
MKKEMCYIEWVIYNFNCFGWFGPDRARLSDGTYQGDNKSTENFNEAWEGGNPPKKKKRITKKKKQAEKCI